MLQTKGWFFLKNKYECKGSYSGYYCGFYLAVFHRKAKSYTMQVYNADGRIRFQVFAEPWYKDIETAPQEVIVVSPHCFEDFVAAEDFVFIADEKMKKLCLFYGEGSYAVT